MENKENEIDFGEKIFVSKKSWSPTLSGNLETHNVLEIYEGSQSPIIITSKKKMKFSCSFENIKQYPFGNQKCSMYFYINGVSNNLTNFTCQLNPPEPQTVGQYFVQSWDLTSDLKDDENVIKVTMTLSRRFFRQGLIFKKIEKNRAN